MDITLLQSSQTLQKFFPSNIYALFIATTQLIYTPETDPGTIVKRESQCDELQQIAFWAIFSSCCILIALMGQTHDNPKAGGSIYDINKCFHWKYYSCNNVIHIIASLVSFVALVLCGHDASICIGLDPKTTQYIPAITAFVFSLVWQAIFPTQPIWFYGSTEKKKTSCKSDSELELIRVLDDWSLKTADVSSKKLQYIQKDEVPGMKLTKQPDTSSESDTEQDELDLKPKKIDPSQNWIAFYATFPKYHCAAYNSLQAIILADQENWGRIVLLILYGLQSVLIIIQHIMNKSEDWSHRQDILMAVAIWLNFTAITIFQHDTAEYLFGGVGCFSNVIPVALPMLVCFIVTEFGTPKCLKRYAEDLASTNDKIQC